MQALDRVAHLSDNPRLSQSELVAERLAQPRDGVALVDHSDLVDSALPARDLAAAVDSMELLLHRPGRGRAARDLRQRRRANPNASVASVLSICSDADAFLQNPQLSLGSSASSSAPSPCPGCLRAGDGALPGTTRSGRAVIDRSSCAATDRRALTPALPPTPPAPRAALPLRLRPRPPLAGTRPTPTAASRARSSSDQSRPLWRGILKHIEELEMA